MPGATSLPPQRGVPRASTDHPWPPAKSNVGEGARGRGCEKRRGRSECPHYRKRKSLLRSFRIFLKSCVSCQSPPTSVFGCRILIASRVPRQRTNMCPQAEPLVNTRAIISAVGFRLGRETPSKKGICIAGCKGQPCKCSHSAWKKRGMEGRKIFFSRAKFPGNFCMRRPRRSLPRAIEEARHRKSSPLPAPRREVVSLQTLP